MTPALSSRLAAACPALERVGAAHDLVVAELDARRAPRPRRAAPSLRSDGTWSIGPEHQADPRVAEREQVAHRLLDGHLVVAGHPRERQLVDRRR